MHKNETVTVLLVDDNEIDVMGVERAFRKSKFNNSIVVAPDGREALTLLRGKSVERPYLVLLDLNMPRMNGIEFLNEIRQDEELKDSVVFVLTTSKAPEDMRKAYERNIAGYIVKDGKREGLIEVTHLLERYTKICELPHVIQ